MGVSRRIETPKFPVILAKARIQYPIRKINRGK